VSAGTSALQTASRIRAASRRLQDRLHRQEVVASHFEQGAAGEARLAEAMGVLEQRGWRLLHDCQLPEGGNIDTLALGPGGVVVLDSKNWSGDVRVAAGRLLQNGRSREKELERLRLHCAIVKDVLDQEGYELAVSGVIALSSVSHEHMEVSDADGILIGGALAIVDRLALKSSGPLVGQRLSRLARLLEASFSGSKAEESRPAGSSDAFFGFDEESFLRLWYLRSWQRGSSKRFYLKTADGDELGWKDAKNHLVTLTCEGPDTPLVAAVLGDLGEESPATGRLSGSPDLLGSILVGRSSRVYVGLLLGTEWRGYGKHRLYGRLFDRVAGSFDLGYLDLESGELHPAGEAKLTPSLAAPERYLRRLRAGWPVMSSSANSAPQGR
jgi:hypothetical protein